MFNYNKGGKEQKDLLEKRGNKPRNTTKLNKLALCLNPLMFNSIHNF